MRWGTLGACLASGLLLLTAMAATAGSAEKDPAARDLIRLTDLGPGYRVGDDGGCGIGPTYEGASRKLRRFNDSHRNYSGCDLDFLELWRPPGSASRPRLINSVATRFAGPADARDAFRIGREFADYNLGVSPRSMKRISAGRTVGDEFRMYRTDKVLVDDTPGGSAVVVIWRTGRTVSMVLVSGKADPTVREEALRLAETQQRRVVTPTPLPAHANDDRFVSLNNPTVDIPIFWLGLRFGTEGLPRLAFDRGDTVTADDPGPGNAVRIEYAAAVRKNSYSGVALDIWRPAAWARFTRTRAGRYVWAGRCTKATRVSRPIGYATIFAGHAGRQKRCGRRPDRFLAHVYLPNAVVAVNMPNCGSCIERGRGPDPWDSQRGMRAVVTGLVIRPRE